MRHRIEIDSGGRDQKELRWQQSGKSEYGPGASCSKAQLPALLDEGVQFSHVQNSLKFIQFQFLYLIMCENIEK